MTKNNYLKFGELANLWKKDIKAALNGKIRIPCDLEENECGYTEHDAPKDVCDAIVLRRVDDIFMRACIVIGMCGCFNLKYGEIGQRRKELSILGYELEKGFNDEDLSEEELQAVEDSIKILERCVKECEDLDEKYRKIEEN